jgi:hypothetical protein
MFSTINSAIDLEKSFFQLWICCNGWILLGISPEVPEGRSCQSLQWYWMKIDGMMMWIGRIGDVSKTWRRPEHWENKQDDFMKNWEIWKSIAKLKSLTIRQSDKIEAAVECAVLSSTVRPLKRRKWIYRISRHCVTNSDSNWRIRLIDFHKL